MKVKFLVTPVGLMMGNIESARRLKDALGRQGVEVTDDRDSEDFYKAACQKDLQSCPAQKQRATAPPWQQGIPATRELSHEFPVTPIALPMALPSP